MLTSANLGRQALAQLIDAHGVHGAVVIAGNHVKVVQAKPVLVALRNSNFMAVAMASGSSSSRGNNPAAANSATVRSGFRSLRPAQTAALGHLPEHPRRPPPSHPAPAVALEVVGHTANGIHRVVPDIDHLVAVKIDGILAVAAGHKLAVAHGAGIGAGQIQRVKALLAGQDQVVFQLAGKKCANALG